MRWTLVPGAVALLLLLAFDPAVTWWFPSCPLYALTGWLCPLCGSLRAIHALLLGAPAAALALNPLTTIAVVACLFSRTRVAALVFSPRGAFVLIAFGIVRNFPAAAAVTWISH